MKRWDFSDASRAQGFRALCRLLLRDLVLNRKSECTAISIFQQQDPRSTLHPRHFPRWPSVPTHKGPRSSLQTSILLARGPCWQVIGWKATYPAFPCWPWTGHRHTSLQRIWVTYHLDAPVPWACGLAQAEEGNRCQVWMRDLRVGSIQWLLQAWRGWRRTPGPRLLSDSRFRVRACCR